MHKVFLLVIISAVSQMCLMRNVSAQPELFIRQGPGAKAGGLGSAYTSIADDASATYWNPAGLTYFTSKELMASHIDLPGETLSHYHDSWCFILPKPKRGTFGMDIARLITFNKNNALTDSYTGVSLSYANFYRDILSLGITTRLIFTELDIYEKIIWTNDVSLLVKGIKQTMPDTDVGIQIKNVAGTNTFKNSNYSLPLVARFGISNRFSKKTVLACDIEKTQDANLSWAAGFENMATEFLALRAGIRGQTKISELNAGVGFITKHVSIGTFVMDIFIGANEDNTFAGASGRVLLGK